MTAPTEAGDRKIGDALVQRARRASLALLGTLGPLIGLSLLVFAVFALEPLQSFRGSPPVEEIAVERTVLDRDLIELHIRNEGPDEVTIAQVLVNEAYWVHQIGDRTLGRLESTTVRIAYPWDEGNPLDIVLVTSTGATIEYQVEAAVITPRFDAGTLGTYTLIGTFVGVIPVTLGLLWFGALQNARRRTIDFVIALTLGLLSFLLIETTVEGLEVAELVPASLDGVGIFAFGALVMIVAMAALQSWLGNRTSSFETPSESELGEHPSGAAPRSATSAPGLLVAYLVATGIGFHNLGEGLGIGTALAVGDVALGTSLIVGFMIHNTTEGIAIIAPLGERGSRPALGHFVILAALAGVPAIPGTWAGGLAISPTWSALAFGVAAGAIVQVLWVVGGGIRARHDGITGALASGFATGLAVMYATGLFTV